MSLSEVNSPFFPVNMTTAGSGGGGGSRKKKQRVGSNANGTTPSTIAVIIDSDETLAEPPHKPSGGGGGGGGGCLRRSSSLQGVAGYGSSSEYTTAAGEFCDSSSADVLLRLYFEKSPLSVSESCSGSDPAKASDQPDLQLYLHSAVLRRAKYFEALLSDRWLKKNSSSSNPIDIRRLNLGVSATYETFDWHFIVLKLLYTNDFADTINNASTAISILPVALELLFEDCVRACIEFLEAVPWTEEEENKVLALVPLLKEEESQELLARVLPVNNASSEELLHGLIMSAIHTYSSTMAQAAKAFVTKLLSDFSSKEMARRVLDRAFLTILKVLKDSLEKYSNPFIRGDHHETEALQRLNLHSAMTSGRHLFWLIERMIELRVADTAAKEWSDMGPFTSDLRRILVEDSWKNIVPGLHTQVLRCTNKLANAVATGNILAPKQVRMGLVKDWLPVLIVSRDKVSSMSNNASLNHELEKTFLKIISTLPMADSQKLLQKCLSFSTKNVDDCPHLVDAFTTWFRRANRA